MDDIRKHMRQITRMAQSYVSRAMQSIDLSPAQMQGLRTVCFHPGISQQGLADHLGIDKAAIARIITVLEGKGYLTRALDSQDGRVKRLTATDSGHALKDVLIASETHFYEHIFGGLSGPELEQFAAMLAGGHQKANALRKAGYTPLHSHPKEEETTPCS